MSDTTLPDRSHSARWYGWLVAWGPVIAFMALIFFFSAQPKTAPPGDGAGIYFSGVMPIFTAGAWDFAIKKASHVIGYAILSALLMRALWRSGDHAPRTVAYLALLLAVGYGLTDELHQSFVPGRNASALDIGFDALGALFAGLVGWRWLRTRRANTKDARLPHHAP